MRSLRSGLTLWLWTTLALVGVACAVLAIVEAQRETRGQIDYQMLQVARIIAGQPIASGGSAQGVDSQLLPDTQLRHDRDDDLVVTVRNDAGALLYASRSGGQSADSLLPREGEPGIHTVTAGGNAFRLLVAKSRGLTIQVAQSMEAISEAERDMAFATLRPIGLLLPVLALVIALVIRRGLRPLDRLADAISQRPPLSVAQLPATDVPVEAQPLIAEINRLLGRLAVAVQREQRFVADAAHALRTPLTALQLQADVLADAPTPAERETRLLELRAGIRRVVRLSQQLLSLARNQTGEGSTTTSINLDNVLEDVVAHYSAAALGKNIQLTVEASSKGRVQADPARIALIVGNLLDNAIRVVAPGGKVEVNATRSGDAAKIVVCDEGPGFPEQELEHAFERFHRGAGNDGLGGGLGLSTVEALVGQLGGSVRLENRRDRTGLKAIVLLPLAMPESAAPRSLSA